MMLWCIGESVMSRFQSLAAVASTLAVSLAMVGCGNMSHRDKSTVVGAGVGGVAGAVLTGGSTGGTIGGAAVGGVIGNQVGKKK
jgi:osmotically inducible lipoprotein OsmB